MEVLTIIGVIVGILVGAIALLEKLFGFLPLKSKYRKAFENGFSDWKESGFTYIPKHDEVKRFLGHALRKPLDDQRNIFALLCAIQHGDKSLHKLIERNHNNRVAPPFVFDFVSGRGIRVGWRAEFVLSKLNKEEVKRYIVRLPEEVRNLDGLAPSIKRIMEGRVEEFIAEQLNGENQKLKTYANEVLTQICSRILPKPSL